MALAVSLQKPFGSLRHPVFTESIWLFSCFHLFVFEFLIRFGFGGGGDFRGFWINPFFFRILDAFMSIWGLPTLSFPPVCMWAFMLVFQGDLAVF